jgi:hypothetical protein
MEEALRSQGCRIIRSSPATQAPFKITFETPQGERLGIVAYAFLATFTPTTNRPADEHSFQLKYGTKDGELHELWQDPHELYTTLLIGINPQQGFFVAADPVLYSPTKFFIRVEFKQEHVDEIKTKGWHHWERPRRSEGRDEPVSVMVGGTAASFLRLVRFEREALGEDQGHRALLAEKAAEPSSLIEPGPTLLPAPARLHELARELELDENEVLDLIAKTRRLKMAVRGWVAEEHLVRALRQVDGVTECNRLDIEGGADVALRFENGRPLVIECKNVLRKAPHGIPRVDFMRTRTSQSDPCSRFYGADDFDVVAACLHAVSERWEFRFARPRWLDAHAKCHGKLSNGVRIDERWSRPVADVLREASKSSPR